MVATTVILSAAASASSMETLLMPGKLSRAHAKLESNCAACHDRAHPRRQTALCLGCHKQVAADIRDRRGYHGHLADAGTGECRACHPEHKGRAADIVSLSRPAFDHRLTGFPLTGAHAALPCSQCHTPHRAWRDAPQTCRQCHLRDDVHHGQFRRDCGACHSTRRWSDARFDHRSTRFALTGAHATLACAACHLGGHYAGAPTNCAGCHATDDVHRGSRGEDCGRCHVTRRWRTARFDHAKETGFALRGVHAKIDCIACHTSGDDHVKIPKRCAGCHRADDAHAGRFGHGCADCHDDEHWQVPAYDHAARDHFALLGAHAKLACDACHTAATATQKLPKDCIGCHRGIDPHGGHLHGECSACHGQTSWRRNVVFDHDLSNYPLLGMHRLAACAQCHATMRFAGAPRHCDACHAPNDVHHGGLGHHCSNCHTPNGWGLWTFDHDTQTHFPLRGAHRRLACAACHQAPLGVKATPRDCASCHAKDDRHQGQFGRDCGRCHTEDSWQGASLQ